METALQPNQPRAVGVSRLSVALPLLAAVLVMLTFVTIPPAPVDLNVDADTSLSGVLNYAQQHGLQFGPELVSTYGPLGYLIFFYFSPHAAGMRMMVDVTFCLTVAAGLCLVAWRLRPVWRCLLLGVFMFVAPNLHPRTDLVIDTGFLCWGLLCFVETDRRVALSVLTFIVLAVFGALAKTSVIFMAGLSIVLVAGGLAARGEWRLGLGMVAGFGVGIPLAWMAAGQNLWHLGSYLINALVLVQGYNQALGWEGLPQVMLWAFLLMLAGMAMVIIRALTAFEGRDGRAACRRGLLLVWVSSLLFLVWKHGVVRGDSYHVVHFFGFLSLLAPALEILPCESRAARLCARALTAACCVLPLIALQGWFFPATPKSLPQAFRAFRYNAGCLLRPGDYQRRMNDIIEAKRHEARLPQLHRMIGSASVDVFGQHQVYALFNNLNYRPRPVFQSYVACNAALMRLNEAFYLSGAAPEYVMFSLGPIDRKFPPLEDAMVLRHLMLNYEPAGAEGEFLLLRSKPSQEARLKLLREGVVRPGERIELSDFGGKDLWLEIDLEPTLLGRLRQFLYQPSAVRLAAWREGAKGVLTKRRAPAAMLAAGFVASPLLLNNGDLLGYYNGKPPPRPGAYSVELLPGEGQFWRSAVRFRVFQIRSGGASVPANSNFSGERLETSIRRHSQFPCLSSRSFVSSGRADFSIHALAAGSSRVSQTFATCSACLLNSSGSPKVSSISASAAGH
jgi:hypothetical protein